MKFIGAGARPGQPLVHRDAVFTVPNVLTVVRFLGVPLFIWLGLSASERARDRWVVAFAMGQAVLAMLFYTWRPPY